MRIWHLSHTWKKPIKAHTHLSIGARVSTFDISINLNPHFVYASSKGPGTLCINVGSSKTSLLADARKSKSLWTVPTWVALPQGAMGLSAICDCGIS